MGEPEQQKHQSTIAFEAKIKVSSFVKTAAKPRAH